MTTAPHEYPALAGVVLRCRMAQASGIVDDGWLVVDHGKLLAVGRGRAPEGPQLVVPPDSLVAPGFVDIHVHGGGGHQVFGDDPPAVARAIDAIARFHVQHGTTSFLPTSVSDRPDRLVAVAVAVRDAAGSLRPGAARVLGLHLEGPWLAPSRAGAHARGELRTPDPREFERLAEAGAGSLRMVTIAPELAGSERLIAMGRAAGIVMSVGHTEADFATTIQAFAAGARHVTHLGNAMAGIDRRAPGPVAAAVVDGGATVEVIPDAVHTHPGFLRLVAATMGDRMAAVTDASAAAGMPPGSYRLGRADVHVEAQRVVLAGHPDTLAGSMLTMDRAVATLVESGVGMADALRAATATPASVIGAVGKGMLRTGADADLVVLDRGLRAVATVVAGQVAWDPRRLLTVAQWPAGAAKREPLEQDDRS